MNKVLEIRNKRAEWGEEGEKIQEELEKDLDQIK